MTIDHSTDINELLTAMSEHFTDNLAISQDNALLHDTRHGYYIGIMSGTSLDGLDVVLCQFEPTRLIATHTQNFDDTLKAVLLALCQPDGIAKLDQKILQQLSKHHSELVSELDFFGIASQQYAHLCVTAVNHLLAKADIGTHEVIAMGVHGQTVRHRPNLAFSLQLFDPNVLAEITGISVVSDFRRRDMAVGGQGAPLVPAFHQAVFGSKQNVNSQTVVLNLGGIANITILGETVLGYDTGVANLLMDAWINRHLHLNFDKNGTWAKSGKIQQRLLDKLLTHEFLSLPAPKSTGREAFNLAWLDNILASCQSSFAHEDVQATLCEFTAITTANEIQKYQKSHNTLYVCGGGAYNTHLLERLKTHLPAWNIATTDCLGIAPTWVEAMCFAWLARQTLLGEPANLPKVTGARHAVVLGQVCFS